MESFDIKFDESFIGAHDITTKGTKSKPTTTTQAPQTPQQPQTPTPNSVFDKKIKK